ncbi:MAG: AraC family transcriptional regulator [Cyclobacteriaceae bacterium]|jgi:AraC-like DNA-binding protein|nr:AraC family transcriptional regulator [Cyclobacteriaceae bacterium]MDH4297303.1 AraC family transcriptional regulator [Cyclobacteriaceae bacterium]MDH5250634.1 AraC family transcriptional regulator [Cyclobacteriaceae bacterium]
MLNFYKIVKENLSFNRFEFKETVCLEYTCPLEAEQIGIFSKNDYLVHVLSGKKTYKTLHGEWTLLPGQTLYLKKGAEVIHQYFDDEYCMLGFFITDDLIRETYKEVSRQTNLNLRKEAVEFTAAEVQPSSFLEGYFHSMLTYFRGENRPPDHILVLKLKELLITLMNCDPVLTAYFKILAAADKPSLQQIMENNFCFNLRLEDYAEISHRSLSTFKRDFQEQFGESPGKWILKRRIHHAANIIANSNLSVSQVAYESGFEDLSHFSRVFKKMIGANPTDYKKSITSA